jgi:uncharacterized membrane protein
MTGTLPTLPSLELIKERLPLIYPEGIPHRNYYTREIAQSIVFVMFYVGAVEGTGTYLRPDQVRRMTDAQAEQTSEEARTIWRALSISRNFDESPDQWYAVNTRESIRDESLRDAFIRTGAVIVKEGVPTTSSKPRYAMSAAFAALFNPSLTGAALDAAITGWQTKYLSAGGLARIQIISKGATSSKSGMMVTYPSGETRKLAAGPSSPITKAVIEEFATRFLSNPAVIFLSESGNKVVSRDDELATSLGLKIPADRYLPDILLVDLAPAEPLLIFVEVVATDGPISPTRKQAFLEITRAAKFQDSQVAFVNAFLDRSHSAFKKAVPDLAWQSFAWFVAEPDNIVFLKEGEATKTAKLWEMIA